MAGGDNTTVVLLVVGCMCVACAIGLVLLLVYLRNQRAKNKDTDKTKDNTTPTNPGNTAPKPGPGPGDTAPKEDIVAALEKQLSADAGKKMAYTCTGKTWGTQGLFHWTNGFMTGCWWKMHALTKNDAWKKLAEGGTAALSEWRGRDKTHDIGFVIMSSYGNAPSPDAGAIKAAAASLAKRWIENLQAIRSWGDIGAAQPKVIIDSLMNLRLLFEGAKLDGANSQRWKSMALAHAKTVAATLVRSDGSTYHVATYPSASKGAKPTVGTHQGAADSSTWARGQAWALYGFTEVYSYTQDGGMLDTAKKVADYFVRNLPSDKVPFWDFSKKDHKDTSAAAIAAAGLLKLGRYEPKYTDAANSILDSLKASYLGASKNLASLLCCACVNVPKDEGVGVGYVVADYYFLEALQLARG